MKRKITILLLLFIFSLLAVPVNTFALGIDSSTIISTVPADGDTNVPTSGNIVVTFHPLSTALGIGNFYIDEEIQQGTWNDDDDYLVYTIPYSNLANGQHTFSLSEFYFINIPNAFSYSISFWVGSELPPKIVSTIPADGQNDTPASGSIVITFDQSMSDSYSYVSLDGERQQGTWNDDYTVYSVPYANLADGQHTFNTSRFYNISGDVDNTTVTFWVKSTSRPRIVSTIPTDGEKDTPASGDIIITFDQPIDPASGAVLLGGEHQQGTWNDDYTVYTVPYSNLANGQHTLDLNGFHNENGNVDDTTITFGVDSVRLPRIISTIPKDGEKNTPTSGNIVITFDQPMRPSDYNAVFLDGVRLSNGVWNHDYTSITFPYANLINGQHTLRLGDFGSANGIVGGYTLQFEVSGNNSSGNDGGSDNNGDSGNDSGSDNDGGSGNGGGSDNDGGSGNGGGSDNDGGSGNDSGSDNDGGSGNGGGSDNDGSSDNDGGSGNGGGSDNDGGSGNGGSSDNDGSSGKRGGSGNGGSSDNDGGSGNGGSSDNGGGSGNGGGSDNDGGSGNGGGSDKIDGSDKGNDSDVYYVSGVDDSDKNSSSYGNVNFTNSGDLSNNPNQYENESANKNASKNGRLDTFGVPQTGDSGINHLLTLLCLLTGALILCCRYIFKCHISKSDINA